VAIRPRRDRRAKRARAFLSVPHQAPGGTAGDAPRRALEEVADDHGLRLILAAGVIVSQDMVKKKNRKQSNPVVNGLRQVLADSYALLAQTHLCHWNVEGPGFFALHAAFEQQYTELFTAVDEIAERIRALGSYAPGGLSSLAKIADIKELPEDAAATDMVSGLRAIHKKLIKAAADTRDIAAENNDKESEDLMIARIQVHEKTAWMLDSYLK
jgi:starvation-inducible DNA-binding protein